MTYSYPKPLTVVPASYATVSELSPRLRSYDTLVPRLVNVDLFDSYPNTRRSILFDGDDDFPTVCAAAAAYHAWWLSFNLEDPADMIENLTTVSEAMPAGYLLNFGPTYAQLNALKDDIIPLVDGVTLQVQQSPDDDLYDYVADMVASIRAIDARTRIWVQIACGSDTAQVIANAKALQKLQFHLLILYITPTGWSNAYTVLQTLRPLVRYDSRIVPGSTRRLQ
jgi:hypothetical protein